jgi:hypothetical protein
MVAKILSGGQTGADRAALDFAIARGIPHGGWCPKSRVAEDGPIPNRYQLIETPEADYAQRTEWNVRDADGTVIFSIAETLKGGSLQTARFATHHQKPCLHLSRLTAGAAAAKTLEEFLQTRSIKVLNIAGPRQSEEPEIASFVTSILQELFLAGQADDFTRQKSRR